MRRLTGFAAIVAMLALGKLNATGPHKVPRPSYSASTVCFRDGITDALLRQPGRLVVHVVDAGGEALPAAEVSLSPGLQPPLVSHTDRAGRVLYSNLEDRRYDVRVELAGFVTARVKKVAVRYGCMSAISVPLDTTDIID